MPSNPPPIYICLLNAALVTCRERGSVSDRLPNWQQFKQAPWFSAGPAAGGDGPASPVRAYRGTGDQEGLPAGMGGADNGQGRLGRRLGAGVADGRVGKKGLLNSEGAGMFAMKWMCSVKFLIGAMVGYVLGARAGREQYDKLMSKVDSGKDQLTQQARESGAAVIDRIKDKTPFGSEGEENRDRGPARSAQANGRVVHASGRG